MTGSGTALCSASGTAYGEWVTVGGNNCAADGEIWAVVIVASQHSMMNQYSTCFFKFFLIHKVSSIFQNSCRNSRVQSLAPNEPSSHHGVPEPRINPPWEIPDLGLHPSPLHLAPEHVCTVWQYRQPALLSTNCPKPRKAQDT